MQPLELELISQFFEYYGKNWDSLPAIARTAWLSVFEKLDPEQFYCALERAIIEFRFLPSPRELSELVVHQNIQPLQDWQVVMEGARAATPEANLQLSEPGRYALRSVGGLYRLSQIPPDQAWSFVQKDFVQNWGKFSAALASGKLQPLPKQRETLPLVIRQP